MGLGRRRNACGGWQAQVGEKHVLSDGRRALKAALDEAGNPKVMLPQMIMAKLTQMLTGKAAKNEGLTRRRRGEQAAAAAAVPVAKAAAPRKTIRKRGARLAVVRANRGRRA